MDVVNRSRLNLWISVVVAAAAMSGSVGQLYAATPRSLPQPSVAGAVGEWRNEMIIKLKSGVTLEVGPAPPSPAALAGTASGSNLSQLMAHHRVAKTRKAFVKGGGVAGAAAKSVAAASSLDRIYVITIADGDVGAAAKAFAADPSVEYAEPNGIVKANYVPNDTYYPSIGGWGQMFDDLWGLKAMNLASAWDKSKGQGVVVAVIDTGVDQSHEDIAANLWTNVKEIAGNGIDDDLNGFVDDNQGWDFIGANSNTPTPDKVPNDLNGHGTHVSGTIAAIGGNGKGVIGVAPNAKIMPLKALADDGYGSWDVSIQAIKYAVDNGAKVINMSLGGVGYSNAMRDAVLYATTRGVTVVVASGNEALDAAHMMPANIPEVITVGAMRFDGTLASFSNYGAKVDVVAPGEDILSLLAVNSVLAKDTEVKKLGDKYAVISGTSMATPHVAGLVALMLSQKPTLNSEQIRNRLRKTAQDKGVVGWDLRFGSGLVNANQALSDTTAITGATSQISAPSAMLAVPFNNVTAPGSIKIRGSANGAGFKYYTLSYSAVASDGTVQFGTFYTGVTAVTNGDLGTISAAGRPLGDYAIRLSVYDANGAVQNSYASFRLDNVKKGWPQLPSSLSFNSGENRTLAFADLDGDKKQEVIVVDVYGRSYSTVFVYKHDGTVFPGFPIQLPLTSVTSPVAIADLDKDGKQEIVMVGQEIAAPGVKGNSRIYAIRSNGTAMPGFPAGSGTGNTSAAPTLADIDGDGWLDIVVRTWNFDKTTKTGSADIMAVDKNGQMKAGWPINQAEEPSARIYPEKNKIAVTDVDNDGKADILYLLYDTAKLSRLQIFGGNGLIKRDVTLSTDALYPGNDIIAGDMDGDGKVEIFTLAGGKGFLLDNNLAVLPGWPKVLRDGDWFNSYIFTDVDNNGDLEVAYLSRPGNPYALSAYKRDGTQAVSYPVYFDVLPPGMGINPYMPSMVDARFGAAAGTAILSDSIVTNKYYAVDAKGKNVPGWPKDSSSSPYVTFNAPTVGDLDGDGKLEIGTYRSDGLIHIFSETAAYGNKKPVWPVLNANNARTNTAAAPVVNPNLKRTVVFVYAAKPATGLNVYLRGGIDSVWSNANRGTQCNATQGGLFNSACAIPIDHMNWLDAATNLLRVNDLNLDWGNLTAAMDGREAGQSASGVGTPAVWTTNATTAANKLEVVGNGYTPLNTYGVDYWMVDVMMDCSKTVNGWFEFKTYTYASGGSTVEGDIVQTQFGGMTPPSYPSKKHFAKCGMISAFSLNVANPIGYKTF